MQCDFIPKLCIYFWLINFSMQFIMVIAYIVYLRKLWKQPYI